MSVTLIYNIREELAKKGFTIDDINLSRAERVWFDYMHKQKEQNLISILHSAGVVFEKERRK